MENIQSKLLIKPPRHNSNKVFQALIASRKQERCPSVAKSPSISSLNSSFKSEETRSYSISHRRKRYHSLTTIPKISATSWTVVDKSSGAVLHSWNSTEIREIASLTKIMTCIVSLQLIKQLEKNWQETFVKVSYKASQMIGTTANLRVGDELSLKSLLYGLMLPSGNDAAWVLAEYFGNKLFPNSSKPVRKFIAEMNKTAKALEMNLTTFNNPHGLIQKRNLSCAKDVAKLAVYAMKNEVFKYIVNCKRYVTQIVGQDGRSREEVWENTNKLLERGFDGVKTGITCNAGPCLCACSNKDVHVVIVLLNSETLEARWVEAKKLAQWARLKFY